MHILLIKSAGVVCDDHFHGLMDGLSLYIFQTGIYLKNQGFEVDVIDSNGIQNIDYGDYGVVCAFVCLPTVFYREIEYLRSAKEAGKITIIFLHNSFGGIEEEIMADYAFIDYAVINHNREISLSYLLKKLKESPVFSLDQNCGIIARSGNQTINYGLRQENHSLGHLVSSVPLLEQKNLRIYKRDNVYMRTGRGCPYTCQFCEIRSTIPYKRKIEHIMSEVRYLSKYFSHFYFVDPDISFEKKWLMELCDTIINERLNFTWEAPIRANACSDINLLKKMKQSGCVMLTVGVETLDSSTGCFSDKVNKNINQDMLNIAETNLKKVYIFPLWSFIIGFPWDSDASFTHLENFMHTRYGTFIVQILKPFMDSPIYTELKKKGVIEHTLSYKDFIKTNTPLCRTDFLSKDEVYRWYLKLVKTGKDIGRKNKSKLIFHDGLVLYNRHNRIRVARYIRNAIRKALMLLKKWL